MSNELETRLAAVLQREIERCVARINECEAVEAARPEPKLRAANDRDRDRAFVALRRAMTMLKHVPVEQVPAPEVCPEVPATPPPATPPIARNAPCPCKSGQKYKRCCGRLAPPLPLRQPSSPRRLNNTPSITLQAKWL